VSQILNQSADTFSAHGSSYARIKRAFLYFNEPRYNFVFVFE